MKRLLLSFWLTLLLPNWAFNSDFKPVTKGDNYLERNYELLNAFYGHSNQVENNPIKEMIEKFANNYLNNVEKNTPEKVYYEQYMSRLILFFVNMIYSYNNSDTSGVLELLKLDASEENTIKYAEKLYLNHNKDLIKGAEIAFKKNLSVKDLDNLQFNNAKGIDVVYANKNIINNHLISLIFYKLLKSDCHGVISSESLGISLPVHIWFKLIVADQRTKMLIYKEQQKNTQIYDPKVIIEQSFKNNMLESDKKLDQILNNLYIFSYEDFSIIENSFQIIKNTEDLRNFNKNKHFFLFKHIGWNNNNRLSFLINRILARILGNDDSDFYYFLRKTELVSTINDVFNLINIEGKDKTIDLDETINFVNSNYINDIYFLFKDIHPCDKDKNTVFNNMYLSLVSDFVNKFFKYHCQQIVKNLANDYERSIKYEPSRILNAKKIVKMVNDFTSVFDEIKSVADILKEDLKGDFLSAYNELVNSFKYEQFSGVKVVSSNFSFSSDFQRIKAYQYDIEIFKVLFLKLVKDKIIKSHYSLEESMAEIKKYGKVKISNKPINLFEKHDIYLNNIDELSYKTKNRSLIGVDLFIFNKYLREIFFKIYFVTDNYALLNNNFAKSEILNIKLAYKDWFSLFKTLGKKPYESQELVNNVFAEIVKNYENIDSFIWYDNQHCFLDSYIVDGSRKSLRERLFRHYLYQSNKELINSLNTDAKNAELRDCLRLNFDSFLSKIQYGNKVLIAGDLQLLKFQDKNIVDDYFDEITKKEKDVSLSVKKKNKKNQNTSKKKISHPLKSLIKPTESKKALKVSEIKTQKSNNENRNQKKQNPKISQHSQNKKTQNKIRQVTNKLGKNQEKDKNKAEDKSQEQYKKDSLSEAINYLKYKLTGERAKFIKQQNSFFEESNKSTQELFYGNKKSKTKEIPKEAPKKMEIEENSNSVQEPIEYKTEEIAEKIPHKRNIKKKVRKFLDQCKVAKDVVQGAYNGNMPFISLPSIFYSQDNINRIAQNQKNFLKDRAKNKEDYEKIVKEISSNFYYNIVALDEFIAMVFNGYSLQESEEKNRLVYEAWWLMHQTLNSPLNQQVDISNLAQQISNAFYALDEYYVDFFNFVETNSLHYNFAQQLLKVDGTMNEEELTGLLSLAASEIKYKQFLSDKVLVLSNIYGDIISCSKELQKKINQVNK